MAHLRTVLLVLAATMPLAQAGAWDAAPCPGFSIVDGLGPSCPVEGGFRVLLENGSSVLTHGADPVGSVPSIPPDVEPRPATCATKPHKDHYGLLIYARTSDVPDNYEQRAPEIRQALEMANGLLGQEAAAWGVDISYRMLCQDGELVVDNVLIPDLTLEDVSFSGIVSRLYVQGYNSKHAKYWVVFDGHCCNASGIGTIRNDDRPGADNRNNEGPSWAVTFSTQGTPAHTMMHESGHNLGAVQNSAPHTTGAHHCNDGDDVMCYDDGGPTAQYDPLACISPLGLFERFDCGSDDYFHPRPEEGSYLADHWNLGSPVNRFIEWALVEPV